MWADENSPIFLIELKAVILLEEKNINSQNEVDKEVEDLEESTPVESSKEESENKSKIKKTGKRSKLIAVSFGVIAIILISSLLSISIYRWLAPSPFEKLTEIDSLVRKYYSGDIDDKILDDALATAYMRAINDKYGFYKNTEDSVAVENSFEGNTTGIGVTVFNDEKNNSLTVFRVDEGSPAHKAGIKPYDMITAIDGKTVKEVGFSESVNSIKREIGQKAKITLLRGGKDLQLEITYEEFTRQCVYYEVIENYGYVCITAFNEATAIQFDKAYKFLTEQKVKGFIFDVRDNGGGTVDSVCKILDTLVGECDLITIVYADGSKKVSAKSDANKCDLPMVVLTNEATASASELFAANLRDMAKATLIGNNTYGKGVVQRTYFLKDKSCIRFTVGEFFPAGGKGFNGKGLAPDFEVSFTEEELQNRYTLGGSEPYIKKALERLALFYYK